MDDKKPTNDKIYFAGIWSILVEDRRNPEDCEITGWPTAEIYFAQVINEYGQVWNHRSRWERSSKKEAQTLADRINDHISQHPDWSPEDPASLPNWRQDSPAYGSRYYEENEHHVCVAERIRDCAADGEIYGPNHESWIGDMPKLSA